MAAAVVVVEVVRVGVMKMQRMDLQPVQVLPWPFVSVYQCLTKSVAPQEQVVLSVVAVEVTSLLLVSTAGMVGQQEEEQ